MREDLLTSILAELNATSADIEACAVLSTDGLMIASLLPQGLDPDRVGAMGAAGAFSLWNHQSPRLAVWGRTALLSVVGVIYLARHLLG